MIRFGNNPENTAQDTWRGQLDAFVQTNQQKLAALAWGLQQEWNDSDQTLGIDLKPTPHFVACSRSAIEQLNQNTNGHLQEILGLIDGYQPEEEVLIIVIGDGQIKLIHFQPQPSPPVCFANSAENIDTLIEDLSAALEQKVSLT
ncbi:MAG: hypothetical protein Kow0049_32700 [Stanieria sp.]|jgi:hypothetical protein